MEVIVVDGQQCLIMLILLFFVIWVMVVDDVVQNEIISCIYEKGSVVKVI